MCLSPSHKPEKGCPRLSSDAFVNGKVYFKQYYTTSPSYLLEGVEGDWHAPGVFPGTGSPRPRVSLAEGRCKGDDCHDPLHVSFSNLEAIRTRQVCRWTAFAP